MPLRQICSYLLNYLNQPASDYHGRAALYLFKTIPATESTTLFSNTSLIVKLTSLQATVPAGYLNFQFKS